MKLKIPLSILALALMVLTSSGTALASTGNGPCGRAGATVTISGTTYKCRLIWIAQGSSSKAAASTSSNSSIVFSGQGGLNEQTASQKLSGSYSISWQTFGSCAYYANLSDNNESDLFDADGALTGHNIIHNISTGFYYVKVTTGPPPDCAWKAVFTSIK